MKLLITTFPFGNNNPLIIEKLKDFGFDIIQQRTSNKFSQDELNKIIPDIDAIIAGTQKIDKSLLEKANKLKFISRMGVGVDNIDTQTCLNKNIKVSYTPDCLQETISEYVIGAAILLLRNSFFENNSLKLNKWRKIQGRDLNEAKIGLVGLGKIGSSVANKLKLLGCQNILFCDPLVDQFKGAQKMDLNQIIEQSDLISLHVPLNESTKGLINYDLLKTANKNLKIINTSRGELIKEEDLQMFLMENQDAFAVLDVFVDEPYYGKLKDLGNTFVTPHSSGMTFSSRNRMEEFAAKNVLGFFSNKDFKEIESYE